MFDPAQQLLSVNFQIAVGVLFTPVMLYVAFRVEDRGVAERLRKLGYSISMSLIASGLLFRFEFAPTALGNAVGPILGAVAFFYALRITWIVRVRDDILKPAVPLEETLCKVATWSMAMIAGGLVAAIRSI